MPKQKPPDLDHVWRRNIHDSLHDTYLCPGIDCPAAEQADHLMAIAQFYGWQLRRQREAAGT